MSPDREPVLRPMRAADVEAVEALAGLVWRSHYPGIITVAQIEYMLAQRYQPQVLRAELARDDLWWDVLDAGGRLIAFSSYLLTERPREMKLDKLYVHPDHQRGGWGRRMIEHVRERARACGCDRLVLAVNRHNAKAIASYRKHGFSIEQAVVKDIGNGFVMDDFIMARAP